MTKKRLLLIASFPLAVALVVGVLAMLSIRPGEDYDLKGKASAKNNRIFFTTWMPFLETHPSSENVIQIPYSSPIQALVSE